MAIDVTSAFAVVYSPRSLAAALPAGLLPSLTHALRVAVVRFIVHLHRHRITQPRQPVDNQCPNLTARCGCHFLGMQAPFIV
jgi:hypothetical protein